MKNMSKKKKIIILSVMIALLLITGYVNVALNSTISNGAATTTSTTYANFYSAYRAERKATRTEEIQFYDSIIKGSEYSAEAKAEAEQNKLALVKLMEKELATEGMIRGKGFTDAIITMSGDNINVYVKADFEIGKAEATQIGAIVVGQFGVENEKVFIISSN